MFKTIKTWVEKQKAKLQKKAVQVQSDLLCNQAMDASTEKMVWIIGAVVVGIAIVTILGTIIAKSGSSVGDKIDGIFNMTFPKT